MVRLLELATGNIKIRLLIILIYVIIILISRGELCFFKDKKLTGNLTEERWKNLERLENNIDNFKPVEIDSELVKQVNTTNKEVADFQKPILTTDGLYNCTGILAYDLNKNYAFLGHSYGNELYGCDNSLSPSQIYDGNHWKTPRRMLGASIHVLEMLDTLSKKSYIN